MNKNILVFSALAFLASCNNNQTSTNPKDTLSEKEITLENGPVNLCFQRVEGTNNQDTTTINLFFNGEKVSGDFNHIPSEKDSRKGAIRGTRNGDTIKALWSFMQEGMNDTLSVEFKLSENELFQKTFGIDASTGRQKLTDSSTFSIGYKKIDCVNLSHK